MTLKLGSTLGRFEITGVLGEGAMGTVYLAHDPQIERPVAIKTLRLDAGGEAQEIASRFLKEAKLAGRLQHPNIVTVYEAGRDQGVDFIAMEYVDGEPLTRLLSSEKEFPLAERVEVVRQVALALEHAHERGVLHRDVKPANILRMRDGRVKVADFGIGKLLTAGGDLTRTGQMIGSPAYMSPEQIRGEKLDGRSDFFSLGVVFYELLTGSRPFPGDTITTLVYQILHTEPRDPLKLRADLPASAREVFARLLAKSPAGRPANAKEFLRAVHTIEKELVPPEETRPIAAMAGFRAGEGNAGPAREAAAAPAAPAREALRPSSGVVVFLFATASVILAAAILITILRRTGRAPETEAVGLPPAVPTAPAAPIATPVPLPTHGPREAAGAAVGFAREGGGEMSTPATPGSHTPRREDSRQARAEPAVASAPPESSVPAGPPADGSYRTRRFAKFSTSPDQARIYLDGRYVGIADDWDDHGGGKTLEIGREGPHRVRLELPGYRTMLLDVTVAPDAKDETVDIGDELKRESKVPFPKIPKLDDRTVGPVEFKVDPPDAEVSEGNRVLGSASSFGPDSPLRLSGPMAHELVLSAPGRKPKTVRVLVASNADREVARVKVDLKKE
jgi:predicted Ser/Thr protein kinase